MQFRFKSRSDPDSDRKCVNIQGENPGHQTQLLVAYLESLKLASSSWPSSPRADQSSCMLTESRIRPPL